MPSVLDLINELAVFEKEPDAVEVTVEDLEEDGFGIILSLIVLLPNRMKYCRYCISLYALFYMERRSLHLEDLIVSQNMRGTGLGTAF